MLTMRPLRFKHAGCERNDSNPWEPGIGVFMLEEAKGPIYIIPGWSTSISDATVNFGPFELSSQNKISVPEKFPSYA